MTTTDTDPWANRITGYDPAVDPEQLLAHPENARRHPGDQREALRESLGGLGWVDVVKVNAETGHVVDGHARVEEALSRGASVPVLYVSLTAEEERRVLLTLDPIGAMAEYDSAAIDALMDSIDVESAGLSDWLSEAKEGATDWDERDVGGDWNPDDDDDSFSGDGEHLDRLGSLVDDPTHECHQGQVWDLWGGTHTLVVTDLARGHGLWAPLLTPDTLFLPYPGPHILMATAAQEHRMLLVQPDAYIAGRILDTSVHVHGHLDEPVLR